MAHIAQSRRYEDDMWGPGRDASRSFRRQSLMDDGRYQTEYYERGDRYYEARDERGIDRYPEGPAAYGRSKSMRPEMFAEPFERVPSHSRRSDDLREVSDHYENIDKFYPERDPYRARPEYSRTQPTPLNKPPRDRVNFRNDSFSRIDDRDMGRARYPDDPIDSRPPGIEDQYLPQRPKYSKMPRSPIKQHRSTKHQYSYEEDIPSTRHRVIDDRRFRTVPSGRGAGYYRPSSREMSYPVPRSEMERRMRYDDFVESGRNGRLGEKAGYFPAPRRSFSESVPQTPYKHISHRHDRIGADPLDSEPIATHYSDPLPERYMERDRDYYPRSQGYSRRSSVPPYYRDDYSPSRSSDSQRRAAQYSQRSHDDRYYEEKRRPATTPQPEKRESFDASKFEAYFSNGSQNTPSTKKDAKIDTILSSKDNINDRYKPVLREDIASKVQVASQITQAIVPVPTKVVPPAPRWQRHNVQFIDAQFDFPAVTNPRGWAKSYELSFSSSYGTNIEAVDGNGGWTGTGDRGLARFGCQLDPQHSQKFIGGQYAWMSCGATMFQQLLLEPGEYKVKIVVGRPMSESGSGNMLMLKTSLIGLGARQAQKSEQKVLSTLVTSKVWVNAESSLILQPVDKPCSVNFEFITQATAANIGTTDVRALIKEVILYSKASQQMGSVYM